MNNERIEALADLVYNQWQQDPRDGNKQNFRENFCEIMSEQPEFRSLDAARIVGLKSQIKALEEAIDVLTAEKQHAPWFLCSERMPKLKQDVYMALALGHSVWPGYLIERKNSAAWIKLDEGEYNDVELPLNSVVAWQPRETPVYKPPEDEFVRRCRIAFQKKQEEYQVTWPNNLGLAEIAGDIARAMNEETAQAKRTSNA